MRRDDLDNLRHSCAHVLAAAVLDLWPEAKLTIGPPIENGFYYDFDFGETVLREIDLPKIEKRMKKILPSWKEFSHRKISPDEAREIYKDNSYKLELIDEIVKKNEPITLYTVGNFTDLCRGGHTVNPSKKLLHFKLLSLAGAYWRGSEKNKMLTRVYGTCFPTKEELTDHLEMLEEAKKRDHRKLGRELDLYFIDETVGKGLVMWLPKGMIVRSEIEKMAIEMEARDGYDRVATPHIAKEELFLKSGHLPYYEDSMYPPMTMDDGTYYLRGMNCPHHHQIYLHNPKSYRDLPLRLAEYGMVYRNELSGTLAGLLRVRGLNMNDAHIYCTKDQIKDEFKKVLHLTQKYFEIFGLENYWFRLSKWSPEHTDKYINEPDNWEFSEAVLRSVLQEEGVKFEEAEDEAAFYGPKVDVQFKSVIGREETMSTIQLDFAAKKRFELNYTDMSGKENNEVFVIHRAPLSVHERLLAFLIEHYAGAFPVWLSPVQVQFAPVSEKHIDGTRELAGEFKEAGIRIEIDEADETVGNKIRKAAKKKIPYVIVVGDKELSGEDLMVRVRAEEKQLQISKVDFIEKVLSEIKLRK